MADWPVYGKIDGPIVMIGFGSIGRGTLPLIERHFAFDKTRMVVVDPDAGVRPLLDKEGIRFVNVELTPANFREVLTPLLTEGGGTGFCVNLSVDTSSLEIIKLCRVIAELRKHTDHVLVHTGQNYDYELNGVFFEQLQIPNPDHFLGAAGHTAGQQQQEDQGRSPHSRGRHATV